MINIELLRRVAASDSGKSIGEYLEHLRATEPALAQSILEEIENLPEDELLRFAYDWTVWGRPKQQPPYYCNDPECGCGGEWNLWLLLSGRAFGKSRTGAEWVHQVADEYPKCQILVIAPTIGDVRRVMIEGESGIIATQKPWNPCEYEPTNTRIMWANGSLAFTLGADEPRRLRGPQYHFVWADELAAWNKAEEVYQQVKLGLRLPKRHEWNRPYRPRAVVTTTPLPTEQIRRMAGAKPFTRDKFTHLTVGSTYENAANLSPDYLADVVKDLEGTRLGRQELNGEILVDVPGALWREEIISPFRVTPEQMPDLSKIVVAVDPAVGGDNATGIVVCGIGKRPEGSTYVPYAQEGEKIRKSMLRADATHGYILADVSKRGSPDEWARAVVRAFHEYEADFIVAESNQGGDMILHTLRTIDPNVPVRFVRATRRKETRAEPIVALFEQGRVHMVGVLPDLENELLTWDPEITDKSPDRLDAMVWGLYQLMGRGKIHAVHAPVSVDKVHSPFFQ